VTTADGAPVADVARDAAPAPGPSRGVARGARLAQPGERGLAPDVFKARVRALAGAP
jgi:hypothetical protein